MRKLAALVLVAVLCACATATTDAMSALTGTYTYRFTNHMIEGGPYQSEDRLEIARIDATNAAVSIGLAFLIGHSCGISGDATLDGDALVLRAPLENDGLPACRLTITHSGDRMVFHDDQNGCIMHYCGMRGRFEGASLPYASRRAPSRFSQVGRSRDD